MAGGNEGNSKLRLSAAILLLVPALGLGTPAMAQSSGGFKWPEMVPGQSEPVMIIRFNQKNVYFQNALRKVIGKVDDAKPASSYELQSVVPSGSTRNPGNDKDFDENLRSVVNVMTRLGVPVSNITFSTITSDSVQNQEIKIIVR